MFRKDMFKKFTAFLLVLVMALSGSMAAFASEDADEEVTVEEGDTPYISFGADLSDSQRATVLELFGISEDDLENYEVVYVTNEMEHEYLDDYLDSDTIGTHALSSVVVMAAEEGSGITVTTKNINYCTSGMYENALATAGIEDADVIVAGPFEISGTAALIGAIEAYSVMTGEDIDETVIDGAIEELVITGEIEEETGDTEEIEGLIAYLKEEVADGDYSTEDIESLIEDAAEEFDVTLTEDQINQLLELLEKLQGLDLDLSTLKSQAQSVYDKLTSMGIDVDTDAIRQEAKNIFQKLIAFIKSLFGQE